MLGNKGIKKCFEELEDPRREGGNKLHDFMDILIISMCGVLCGAEGFTDIELFGQIKKEWFRTFLKLENGIPSSDTFRRIFAAIDNKKFSECFIRWMKDVANYTKGEVVAIDGKTVRRSFDNESNKKAIHMVSAWASKNQLVLGQIKTEEKSNEITAIPKLLELLELKGSTVTIDAMGCQKKIAEKIIEKEADYTLAVKENQSNLYTNIKEYFEWAIENKFKDLEKYDHYTKTEKGHGRIEKRNIWITEDVEWFEEKGKWKNLRTLISVERIAEKSGEISKDTRYFISSKKATAKEHLEIIRSHWGIENNLHWVLDVQMNEDACRVRKDNAAENFTIMRHLALAALKKEKTIKRGIKAKQKAAGWSNDYLMKLLTSFE